MNTVDCVYEGGVFRPLGPVSLPENARAKLLVVHEPVGKPTWDEWEASAKVFRDQIRQKYGVLSDSTPLIREMRDRDD